MTVSVIVPVYNGEKYLKECIDSITGQSYKDLQIIIVDDGSDDGSGSICRQLAEKEGRIEYYRKENCGQRAARNFGIEKAKGDFIAFVDCDDVIDKDMYLSLVKAWEQNKADYTFCGIYRFYADGKSAGENTEKFLLPAGENVTDKFFLPLIYALGEKSYIPSACRTLFLRDILVQNGIIFPNEKEFLGEDLLFNLEYLTHCRSVECIGADCYGYRANPVSFTNKFSHSPKRLDSVFNMADKIEQICLKADIDKKAREERIDAKILDSVSVCVKLASASQSYGTAKNEMKKACRNPMVQRALKKGAAATMPFTLKLFCFLLKRKMWAALYIMIKVFVALGLSK